MIQVVGGGGHVTLTQLRTHGAVCCVWPSVGDEIIPRGGW